MGQVLSDKHLPVTMLGAGPGHTNPMAETAAWVCANDSSPNFSAGWAEETPVGEVVERTPHTTRDFVFTYWSSVVEEGVGSEGF